MPESEPKTVSLQPDYSVSIFIHDFGTYALTYTQQKVNIKCQMAVTLDCQPISEADIAL